MAACTFNPGMAAFYGRLRERGKVHRVTVTAVMRKPVVIANALPRDRRMWEDRTGRVPRRPAGQGTNQPAGHDNAAGPLRRARTAGQVWTTCEKPGPGSPKTIEKDRIRACLQTWRLAPFPRALQPPSQNLKGV